jgi:cytochrome o ubiquinol oxidase subunit II
VVNRKYKIGLIVAIIITVITATVWYLHGTNIQVLNPKGPVALKERNLIYLALLLSLIVVIPVYALTIIFAVKYRETNTKAVYSPDLAGNRLAETIWWIIPTIIISILGVVAWNSSHQLDPYKPLVSSNQPLTIQVIALQWKWLFIYPEQNIGSVNIVQFPSNVPINFQITADAPMNSFWIPQLGGQIYAMPGMSTQLHLLASSNGTFNGSSANISGAGFAGMTFLARSTSPADFKNWVNTIKRTGGQLAAKQYTQLRKPSQNNVPRYYASTEHGLYYAVVARYLSAVNQQNNSYNYTTYSHSMEGMSM